MSDTAEPDARPVTAPTRDRREDGRPEQARPRDRTGRPLPYGTTGVPVIEEHDPASVEEALELGMSLWSQQRFFEAHECLEDVWHAASTQDADLWQGVIQIAVAGVHLQRANPSGARSLLERASSRLAAYPDGHLGIAVADAIARCRALLDELDRQVSCEALDIGPFPAPSGTRPTVEAAPGA